MFSSDLRIRVVETGLGTYPDVSVVCGPLELDPADPRGHTVTNPVLVIEVLSPSTEDYDRGEKLAAFKRIASLREVVLVAHDERRLEIWRRVGAIWTTEIVRGDAFARLERRATGPQLDDRLRALPWCWDGTASPTSREG